MTTLDPGDALGYAVAVGCVAGGVEASLGPEVVANRIVSHPPDGLRLETFESAHARWRRRLAEELSVSTLRVVLRTDVADCYRSMRTGVIVRSLLAVGAAPGSSRMIGGLLERWREEGVEGLPIGPAPSAVLANAVLRGVDRAFRSAGVPHLRWVDDVVAFAPDRPAATRAFDAFRRALDAVGLRENTAKTALVDDPAAAASALQARASTALASAVR